MSNKIIVGASQARQNFFELISLAQTGKDVLVAKRGKPLVIIRALPTDDKKERRKKLLAVANLAKIDSKINASWEAMEKIISESKIPH